MADTRTWIGTDPGNEGDWSVAANWSGATVPITGDTALFDAGSQDVTGGKDQSLINLAKWIVTSDYTGIIASAAAYLQIGATLLQWEGRANAYIDASTGAFNYDDIINSSASQTAELHIKGDIGNLYAAGGHTFLQTGTNTNIYLEMLGTSDAAPKVTAVDATNTSVYVMGGRYLRNSGASGTDTTLNSVGGTATIDGGTLTNLKGYGGHVVWNTTVTLADARMYAGSFDASQDNSAKTITTLELHPGAHVNLINGPGNIVVTNPIIQRGGILASDTGTLVAV